VLIELDPVDRITADAVGEPGSRAFYIQARQDSRVITVLVEKQQVQLLAASVVEILSRVGKETGQGPDEEHMQLEEPVIPEWRAGRLSIGYHEERDLLMLEAEELMPEDEDDEDGEVTGEGLEGFPLSELAPAIAFTEVPGEEEGGNGAGGEDEEALAGDELEESDPDEEHAAAVEELALLDAVEDIADLEALAQGRDPGRIRLWATREQMLSLARHGAAVCAAGRPRCQLCGNPLEPVGHVCPALNGHLKSSDT
jgi:uncharacterized repeat protein (TIGR03847 family)